MVFKEGKDCMHAMILFLFCFFSVSTMHWKENWEKGSGRFCTPDGFLGGLDRATVLLWLEPVLSNVDCCGYMWLSSSSNKGLGRCRTVHSDKPNLYRRRG